MGKQVAQMNANHGRLSIMCQNPTNAILCLGHSKGVVTMWSPNEREPVARMWAHKQPLTSIAVGKSKICQNYEIIVCIIHSVLTSSLYLITNLACSPGLR